jgi:AbiV family abortive infection protein
VSKLEQVRPIFEACITNADALLCAAKELSKPDQRHVSFHLALIALEEVGKASMLLNELVASIDVGDHDANEASGDEILIKRLDDHEYKLCWALWTPSISAGNLSVAEFHQLRALAKELHERRIGSLYVHPSEPQITITDTDLKNLISVTETRLEMEKGRKLSELDATRQEKLDWFVNATGDEQLKRIVFGAESLSKLKEFGGNSLLWVDWLRQLIDQLNAKNQALLQKELERSQGSSRKMSAPKWRLKLKFHTSTHVIRQKNLTTWNAGSEWLQLYKTSSSRELVVFMTLKDNIPIQTVWQAGLSISNMFLMALSMGSLGYFWWYVPSFVAKYYDECFDIENRVPFVAERNPTLRLPVQPRPLTAQDLMRAGAILGFIMRAPVQHQLAFSRYYQALALLARNDIFAQFELNIALEFLEALKLGLKAFSDWDGQPGTFDDATEILLDNWSKPDEREHLKEVMRFFTQVVAEQKVERPITLDDTLKLKCLCDVYFTRRINEEVADWMTKNRPVAKDTAAEENSGIVDTTSTKE